MLDTTVHWDALQTCTTSRGTQIELVSEQDREKGRLQASSPSVSPQLVQKDVQTSNEKSNRGTHAPNVSDSTHHRRNTNEDKTSFRRRRAICPRQISQEIDDEIGKSRTHTPM